MNSSVSIVMPAYQAAAHIEEAMSSLLAQDWPYLDLTVVDDGSTDGTAGIVQRFAAADPRVTLLQQRNLGAGAARDAGIAATSGAFVLLADADDRADPGLVRALVEALARKSADMAYARCRYIDAGGSVVAVQESQKAAPGPIDVLGGFMVNTPLVRRSAIEAIGGHDRALTGSIDLDLRLRLAMRREGAICAVDEVLSDYRRSEGQITSDWRRMEASWTRVRDKACAAGLRLSPRADNHMRGKHCAYWATLAYLAGDYRAARRLMGEAVWRVPGHVARDPQARIRLAACAASLLPRPLHDGLRARFNRARPVRP